MNTEILAYSKNGNDNVQGDTNNRLPQGTHSNFLTPVDLLSTVVLMCTNCFNVLNSTFAHRVFLGVSYGSHKNKLLFP